MGKKSRVKARTRHQPTPLPSSPPAGVVGPRQPCPCGSGRRYKACHGSAAGPVADVRRPAVRGARRRVRPDRDARDHRRRDRAADAARRGRRRPDRCSCARCCRWPRRRCPARTAAIWLGLQVQHGFGDPSRDLAAVLLKALASRAGRGRRRAHRRTRRRARACRTWSPTRRSRSPCTTASTTGSPTSRTPTARRPRPWSRRTPPPTRARRLDSVEAAYWTDVGTREHLRWVLPYDEEPLLDALARLHVAGQGPRSRRAPGSSGCSGRTACWSRCGTCPSGTGAAVLEEPAAQFESRPRKRPSPTPRRSAPRSGAARSGLANRSSPSGEAEPLRSAGPTRRPTVRRRPGPAGRC